MIHRETMIDNGTELLVRRMDGVYDLVDVANERISLGQDRLGNASLTESEEFTGTKSLKKAAKLAIDGWGKGVEQVERIASTIELDKVLTQNAAKIDFSYEIAGDEPDVGRYLAGEPENMLAFIPASQSHGNMLDLVVNVGQHAYVSTAEIENRGASILAAIEALRAHGYSVGIQVVEQFKPSGYYSGDRTRMRYEIPILEAGQTVNVDTLAFSLMHPSFLRRLLFAAEETEETKVREQFGIRRGGGYGMPLRIDDYEHDRPAVIVDKDEGLTTNHDEAEEYAQTLAKRCLSELNVAIDEA